MIEILLTIIMAVGAFFLGYSLSQANNDDKRMKVLDELREEIGEHTFEFHQGALEVFKRLRR